MVYFSKPSENVWKNVSNIMGFKVELEHILLLYDNDNYENIKINNYCFTAISYCIYKYWLQCTEKKSVTNEPKLIGHIFCLDAYGSQLWPFLITLLNCIILHGERLLGKLGACLSLLIDTINNSLTIESLHSCINSSHEVVKSISCFSTFGENYRYVCHKYMIMHYMLKLDYPIIIYSPL